MAALYLPKKAFAGKLETTVVKERVATLLLEQTVSRWTPAPHYQPALPSRNIGGDHCAANPLLQSVPSPGMPFSDGSRLRLASLNSMLMDVDGSGSTTDPEASAGGLVRDLERRLDHRVSCKLGSVPGLSYELWAIYHGLKLFKQEYISLVEMELDATSATNVINLTTSNHQLHIITVSRSFSRSWAILRLSMSRANASSALIN